jgi:hypothetical protein
MKPEDRQKCSIVSEFTDANTVADDRQRRDPALPVCKPS